MHSSYSLIHAGKVRRLYALPDPAAMLLVATDAISAYDFVLDSQIPDKGIILTQMSLWWFDQLSDLVDNHVLWGSRLDGAAGPYPLPADWVGRTMVTERLEMLPVECIARGYITGSGWQEYQRSGTVTGIALPAGLRHGDRLPEPIFTPSTKADIGEHDENISFDQLVNLVGKESAQALRDLTLQVFAAASTMAEERGIILADTKFEFGRRDDGTMVLADEVLTPDSSRFWDMSQYQPGSSIPSFDKQFVRDWLTDQSGWDKSAGTPPPALPAAVIQATRQRYLEAYRR
ncbi:MAG: phosphoribosylaminoimidazolesuccinocarboxamide synthase, partial [Propionibacteriaceae bacterium]|nr:phosphoribosylaminoimidazolesuccinocarboxamide synthase [Propionibacteriaceae bacterium]